MNSFWYVRKQFVQKQFTGPPCGSRFCLRPSLRWRPNDCIPVPEMLVSIKTHAHLLCLWCPQRSAAPGPAAASDLVFVGLQNDSILSPKYLFYQRFLHNFVISGAEYEGCILRQPEQYSFHRSRFSDIVWKQMEILKIYLAFWKLGKYISYFFQNLDKYEIYFLKYPKKLFHTGATFKIL